MALIVTNSNITGKNFPQCNKESKKIVYFFCIETENWNPQNWKPVFRINKKVLCLKKKFV